jgi:hypothetical protein
MDKRSTSHLVQNPRHRSRRFRYQSQTRGNITIAKGKSLGSTPRP